MAFPYLSMGTEKPRLEKDYQVPICEVWGGETEVPLLYGTRVDCLLPEYAIEFDFAGKWAEAIGQSLFYAAVTQRKPGIVLIGKSMDGKDLERAVAKIRIANARVSDNLVDFLYCVRPGTLTPFECSRSEER